ncbi:hypothetical protein G6F46_012311 [Rhizopus delemar]|uniref:DUF6987 domain-containing protein n=3 Tax=Rhizopus TaxID=4842 RepID=I1C8Q8_RHIO9|nr:hypothetical protein RO3G_09548 [Rhizopus delemar RA 99-880]KAG1444393.1 hypothetical protein G6F55_012339 [Rhizopus delemar]KAG1534069.1 hypothetical protein G6F51_012296 [Rhizopus arrhizus]KAG1488188.1 hypothetical protein G6F54_012208 [Rhizopus delemar]KAG1495163.1 hypothetical protein G6F53_012426 [Rhizopus delemar]|eukprot:EIE84838.1 hypothetical protein RO3G_09548 [Rhizopus delemar RA 99-880]
MIDQEKKQTVQPQDQNEDKAISSDVKKNNESPISKQERMQEISEDTEDSSEEESEDDTYESLTGKKVSKSGLVVNKKTGEVIGRLVKGKVKKLAGKKISKHGVIEDEKGNMIGMVEPVEQDDSEESTNSESEEEPPKEKEKDSKQELKELDVNNPVDEVNKPTDVANKPAGEVNKQDKDDKKLTNPYPLVNEYSPEVRKSGKVVDQEDNIVGKVDKRVAHELAGFKVDNDGNIISHEGYIVGKAEMIKEKTEEERKREQEELDKSNEEGEYRKLADKMSTAIQQSLDKIKPILKMITDSIENEEAKPENERDEQKLVDTVKPLIEQASNVLSEADGAVRGLDPTGKIAKTAQANTSQRKASPEEYHLAELLSQLTGEVTTTIDKAKKKVKNMPHAKEQLSPLWNILQSPLLQILSAVGLLLTGVLGLVGNILNGLGLGSIINSLLGGIGLNNILEGFGLGKALNLGKK